MSAQVSWLLGDIESVSQMHLDKNNTAYIYNRTDGSSIAAIWTNSGRTPNIDLKKISKDGRIIDMFGNLLPMDENTIKNILNDGTSIYIEAGLFQLKAIIKNDD